MGQPVAHVLLDGVTHRYGDRAALDELSLDLRPGVTALVGVNGAGKSTLVSILATLIRPTRGAVSFGGRPWPGARRGTEAQIRRDLGLCPQSASLPGSITVVEFLSYAARLRGVARSRRAAAVEAALTAVELTERADNKFRNLSGGMRKRLLIAQAIVHDPGLLLLDEPMESLDPEQRIRIRSSVTALADPDHCILISSHVLADVLPIADRVVMIDAGRLIFDGTPAELDARGRASLGEGASMSAAEAAFLKLREESVARARH
jgi:ABC-2 type transport system ATP-binding protein